ncbi:MAG: NUMOD4 domain-containing protein [Bacteroidota bacterium]
MENTEKLINELWLPVYNYLGFYEVSNLGNVRSLSREVSHSRNPEFKKQIFGCVLSQSLNPQGYFKVRLSALGLKKTHLVHHLVSESFLSHTNRSDFMCVDHIDEDRTNNKLSNLQIITKQENTKKSFDYKLDLFKENQFWFHNTGELVLIFEVTKLHGGTIKCKHISNDSESFAFHHINCMNRLATESEVKEALTKEAIKRGFVQGVRFIPTNGDNSVLCYETFHYVSYCNKLLASGYSVFQDGKWATIIPKEKTTEDWISDMRNDYCNCSSTDPDKFYKQWFKDNNLKITKA